MHTLTRRTALAAFGCAPFTTRVFAKPATSAKPCTEGWFVTGYYTAAETEFAGRSVEIQLEGQRYAFASEFLHKVKTDGWGQTRERWFLGWNNGWRRGTAPLSIRGRPLAIGSAAVDQRLVPLGTALQIPDLPPPWNSRIFTADDSGGGIRGKRIDIYCGCGPEKRAETLRLTGHNHRVCFATVAA